MVKLSKANKKLLGNAAFAVGLLIVFGTHIYLIATGTLMNAEEQVAHSVINIIAGLAIVLKQIL